MPVYDYVCRKCGKKFTITMTISERESKKVRCPKCDSLKTAAQITSVYVQTSRKS